MQLKTFLVVTVIMLFGINLNAQIFEWANGVGGTSNDQSYAVAVDASGNIYTSIGFQGTVDVNPGTGVFNLTSSGLLDAAITKTDAAGNFIWAYQVGTANHDEIYDLQVDLAGNICATGHLGSSNTSTIFKLNSSGSLIWSNSCASSTGNGIDTDDLGNVYVIGHFTGTVDFDPGVGVSNLVATSGSTDIFIVKYSNSGSFIWAKKFGGADTDIGTSITIDASYNVYTTGYWSNTADFDPGAGTFNMTTSGSPNDVFVSKLDASGNFVFAKQFAGAAHAYGNAITLDASGNIYTTGYFGGTTDFDPGAGTFNLATTLGGDIFISKLNNNGVFIWAKAIIGSTTFNDQGYSIHVDVDENVYVTGVFLGTADFDPGPGVNNLTAVANEDIFVCKLDISGNFDWAFGMGASSNEGGRDIVIDQNQNLYVAGIYTNTVDFDPGAGTYNLTSTGGSDAFLLKLDVCPNLSAPSSISGSTSICQGASEIYSVTNDVSATSYTWTLPVGWSGTSTTNSILVNNDGTSGTISVVANNACGSSSSSSQAITVNAIPATPGTITGTTTICSGSTNTYSITAVPGATSYTWTMPSGWTGSSTTNSINTTASSTSGTISVIANNACGSSPAQTLAITVNSVPTTPGTISGTTSICSASSNSYSVTNDPSATSYTWTLPSGWTGTSATNSINTTASSTAGNITVIANNSCGSSSAQTLAITVNSIPSTPGSISGSSTICSGSSNTYSVTNDPSASSYTWTLPSGWTGTSTTNSISATADATSGTISVIANNACGSSSAQTLAIAVNSVLSTPGTISGTTSICSASSNSYSVTNDPSATSYTWTLPSGWTGTSTTNSINTTASSTAGNITVSANNACGSSSAQTLAITVNTSPSTPGSISGSSTICSASSNTYSVINDPSASSYSWTLPGGWSGTSTTNSISATADATSGTISVMATNACGSSAAQNLAITVNTIPTTPATISGSNAICEGSSNNYSVPAVAGATSYTWTLPAGWSGTSTTNSITTTASSTSGNITITANNSCGNSAASTLSIAVNALPTVTLNVPTDLLCTYSSPLTLSGASPSGGTFSGTGVSGGSFNPATAGTGTFTITYTFTDANSCTNTATDNMVVDACLGMNESETDSFLVYPNPTNGMLNLVSSLPSGTIFIYNALGEIIYTTAFNAQNTLIDIAEFEDGMYIIQLINEDLIATKRIIKG